MGRIVVSRATCDEWPQIAALRESFYLRTGMERIPVPPAAVWFSALVGAQVVAALALLEGELNGSVLCITDFYCDPTRLGQSGAAALLRYLDGYDARITGSVPVWNRAFLKALSKRGYVPAEIRMEKDKRAGTH